MKYSRSISKNGNLYPAAFDVLSVLPPQMLHQGEHDSLRHPLATYNLSIGRVLEAFRGVLDQLKGLDAAQVNASGSLEFDPEPLLTAQKELLDSLASHIDDGYQILKAIYPPVDLRPLQTFADRWLEKAGHGKVKHRYSEPVTPYRGSFMLIVNRLKHATGRLRAFVMYDNRQRIGGYYLEAEGRGGVVGSDPGMHPDNTAFSLNRDLRYHFCNLYAVGEALRQALVYAARRDYGITLPPDPVVTESTSIEELAERLSSLPLWFFPDEAAKPTPVVRLNRVGADRSIEVEETRTEVPFVMRTFYGQTIFKGDGVTRSWRVPYMQYARGSSTQPVPHGS